MLGGNNQGDVERDTFDPADRYSAVLMQQGRVQLAADSNEQSAIHLHLLRSLIVDLKGRAWRVGSGFEIDVDTNNTIEIKEGHFYVDGVLCENQPTRPFDQQPFLPKLSGPKAALEKLLEGSEPFGLYLDCWERHVTWLNDSRLREVALGGPDTATRLQVAWQVVPLSLVAAEAELNAVATALNLGTAASKAAAVQGKATDLASLPANANAKRLAAALSGALDSFDDALPLMAAEAKRETDDVDPCAIAADAAYRGRENQLYRVEVHAGGLGGKATFKWSRENSSVAYGIQDIKSVSGAKTTVVRLESLGRDRRSGLCVGDWVELSDRDTELGRQPLKLLKVIGVDEQRLVTLDGNVLVDPSKSAILRRWDHTNPDNDGALTIKETADPTDWVELERGVKIQFALGGRYQPGDYWRFAARVATGDIEWPRNGAVAQHVPPHGVQHHRALLAILTKTGPAKWSATPV